MRHMRSMLCQKEMLNCLCKACIKSAFGLCAGALPLKQRLKSEKATDPLKGVFMRAPRKGGDIGEPLTEMEATAQAEGAKLAKKLAKKQGGAFVPKRNVRSAKNFRKH